MCKYVLLCYFNKCLYFIHHRVSTCVSTCSPCPLKEPGFLDRSSTCFLALPLGGGFNKKNILLYKNVDTPKHYTCDQSLQNLHIWGAKNAHFGGRYLQKKCFAPNAHKSHLGVSHDENLHIWGGQKCLFWQSKLPKMCKKCCLLKMSFGGLTWRKFAYLVGQ